MGVLFANKPQVIVQLTVSYIYFSLQEQTTRGAVVMQTPFVEFGENQ